MAMPVSPTILHRFTPSYYEEGKAPTYLLKVPTLIERAAYNRELQTLGISYPSDETLNGLLREGLDLFNPDNRADLEDALTALEAAKAEKTEPPEDAITLVTDLEALLRQHYQPFAEALAQRAYAVEVRQIVACRMFLRGVENAPFTLKPSGTTLADADLMKLPELDRLMIAVELNRLMNPEPETEKN